MEVQPLPSGRLPRGIAAAAAPGLGPWLLGLLIGAAGFAAFSGGAIAPPAESRLQVLIAAVALLCAGGFAAGSPWPRRAPAAWAGVALLSAFAVWSALSLIWSAAPDESWIAANRAFAYVAVAALALAAAGSTRGAPALAAVGLASVALLVAAYALGGKLAPGFHLGPLDLDPGDRFARLREPIEYWNGLGLICVMATPALIWLCTSLSAARIARVGALLGLAVVLLTATLTYSRGAIIAYAVVLAVMVGAGPRRLPRLGVGLGVPVAILPAVLVAFGRDDLSTSDMALSAREDGGLVLGAVLLVSLIALAMLGARLIRLESRLAWTPRRSRLVWRGLTFAAAGLLLGGLGALALSGRGLGGEISHRIDEFAEPQGRPGNAPERLISSNGSNRYIWWQEAAGAFVDKPVAGWGAGSFPTLHHLYRRYEAPVRSTHSLPLQFLSETGLVGAVLGIGGLGLLGVAAARRVRRSDGPERAARLALLASAAAWAVHCLYDWDWQIPAVTLPALIAVCVAAAPTSVGGPRSRPPARGKPALVGVTAALAALALALSALLPALSEGDRVHALELAAGAERSLDQAAEAARRAHDLNPLSVEPLFAQASIAVAQGNPRLAAAYLREATRTQPDNWQTWARLAGISVELGDRAGAAEALRRSGEANPLLFEPGVASLFGNLLRVGLAPARSSTAFGTPPP